MPTLNLKETNAKLVEVFSKFVDAQVCRLEKDLRPGDVESIHKMAELRDALVAKGQMSEAQAHEVTRFYERSMAPMYLGAELGDHLDDMDDKAAEYRDMAFMLQNNCADWADVGDDLVLVNRQDGGVWLCANADTVALDDLPSLVLVLESREYQRAVEMIKGVIKLQIGNFTSAKRHHEKAGTPTQVENFSAQAASLEVKLNDFLAGIRV